MSTRRPGPDTPLFAISVAAGLAGMHPQTLRLYERRGLVAPRRTARGQRLYSEADLALLGRIQELGEEGLNIAGIERVMALEAELERAGRRIRALEAELERAAEEHLRQLEAMRRSLRPEIVHVQRQAAAIVPRYVPVVPSRPPGAG